MTQVYASVFQDEALVLVSLLESAGIQAGTMNERMLDVSPVFGLGVMGIRIMVPDEQAEDAKALIADYKANRVAGASEPGEGKGPASIPKETEQEETT